MLDVAILPHIFSLVIGLNFEDLYAICTVFSISATILISLETVMQTVFTSTFTKAFGPSLQKKPKNWRLFGEMLSMISSE